MEDYKTILKKICILFIMVVCLNLWKDFMVNGFETMVISCLAFLLMKDFTRS